MTAIIEFYTKVHHWSEEEVKENILRVYNEEGISNYSTFDVKSIMMCVWQSISLA
jgi:hypothetical protein